jgi:hypothetical protein
LLKSCVSGRDPALRGFCKWAAHPADGGTALSKTPRAWADGPILVFQLPAKGETRAGRRDSPVNDDQTNEVPAHG